jgi:CheY-like chemotaxis protein
MLKNAAMADASRRRVLCVDDDRDVAEVVQAVLVDEGYEVTCLYDISDDALPRVIGQFEPDCVLLDGTQATEYGGSWDAAKWLHLRRRRVPVVMLSAHTADAAEAREGTSRRAMAADFAAVVVKPFHIDELLTAVATAVGRSEPFGRTAAAEAERTRQLVADLEAAGATDVQPSSRREWATFRDPDGTVMQLYWWQARGVYQVGRYDDEGRMWMVGQFVDRQTAIDLALRRGPTPPQPGGDGAPGHAA